ncbi:MAG: tRNA (adenosine(37)-N6)-threonylcarbamoyltransferase complex transferase subunit TsaD [Patescibacteria group bacterium]
MKILGIETSCDETAISIIEATGGLEKPSFAVLSEVTITQLDLHKAYGGVVPSLAKREHQRTLMPVLIEAIERSGVACEKKTIAQIPELEALLPKEPDLLAAFLHRKDEFLFPNIDAIAVTHGPGLEPALWVGVNFAKALSLVWGVPIVPVNHMEGHLLSGLLEGAISFPTLGLLVSGGHTELVLAKAWCDYEILGATRDDAVGEAFDKVARLLGLPYPGGPAISKLAEEPSELAFTLPRPMIHSDNYDFSFAGLKTAVLYLTKELGALSDEQKRAIAREFQNAAIDVLISKTKRALEQYSPRSFVIGGGVSANTELRRRMTELLHDEFPDTTLTIPSFKMSTDNATMIAIAGYIRHQKGGIREAGEIRAEGNLSLA